MPPTRKLLLAGCGVALLGVLGAAVVAWIVPSLYELVWQGDTVQLRDRRRPPPAPVQPTALVIAVDGIDRDLLYDLVRAGELPGLAGLLGGRVGDRLPHAHLDDATLAPMPTTTLTSWATIFTGAPPAVHGVAGNEYFIRDDRRWVGPAPVSVAAPDLVLQVYTDGYANDLLHAPTIYERLRADDPGLTAWVGLSHYHAGADLLLIANRSVLADAFAAMIDGGDDLDVYASLDREAVDSVVDALEARAPPRLLTVYLGGADLYAHASPDGPDPARRRYLREVVDPLMARLHGALAAAGALADRYVVVVSDHGHTDVRHDDAHALGVDGADEPPALLRAAGYRVRPFEPEVADDDPFDAVLTYGGAVAYVYLADRSTCGERGPCAWPAPPRFHDDLVPAADAFLAASERGALVPALRGTLDAVLVRPPDDRGRADWSRPHEVYLGGGRTEPVDRWLARHARPSYVDLPARLRALAVGPRGHHAGDLILLARNGDEPRIDDRYYFAGLYHSWHGSPSRKDSEIPFIVAHPDRTAAELAAEVRRAGGDRVGAERIAPVIEALLTAR